MTVALQRRGGGRVADTELPGTPRLFVRPFVAGIGIVLSALVIGSVLLIVASFSGAFSSDVILHAVLPAGANAPQVDSPVEYRDVTVGQVASNGHPIGGGRVSIEIRVKPGELAAVPRSVRATVGPLSIFGNQYVDLETQGSTAGPSLQAGDTIPAIPSGPSASLQSTVANFYDVLSAIHPVQLETTLTAFANGLRGQGESLGQALRGASSYFKQMIPLLPTLENDLQLLSPAADDLAASTPNLLGLISNLTTTSRTIATDATAVHALFAGGAVVSGQAAQLFSTISLPFEQVLADSGPLLDDIDQSPTELARTLTGLDSWAKAWSADESHGPYLSVTSTVDVGNAADLVLAGLDAPNVTGLFAAGLGVDKVNPPTYTSADCPRYGTETGTDCGGSDVVTTSDDRTPNTLSSGEQKAVVSITTGINRGQPPASPAVATLLLGPVLNAVEQAT